MRSLTIILFFYFNFFAGALVLGQVSAYNSNDYFHNGAKMYINNKKDSALSIINQGLKINPNDDKLLQLANKILEEQKKDKKAQKDKQKKQEQKDKQNKEDNKDNQANKKKEEKDKKEQQNTKENDDKKQKEEAQKNAQNNPKMSKEDAERLLNALNNKEKDLHDKLKKKTTQGVRVQIEKDW